MIYTVALYEGSIGYVDNILKIKYVEAPSIEKININVVVPYYQISYYRATLYSNSCRVYDYGNYTKFVIVKQGKHSYNKLIGRVEQDVK